MNNQLSSLLQNPLCFFDGTPVQTHDDFVRRRKEILELIIDTEFGGMPPKPNALAVEPLYTPGFGRRNSASGRCGNQSAEESAFAGFG